MKGNFTNLKWIVVHSFFLILLTLPTIVSGARGDKMSLEQAIQEISVQYEVYFTYNKSLVQEITVDINFSGEQSLDEVMEQVLTGTMLHYRIHDDKFVIIYKSDREGISSLKKMAEHLDDLIVLEENRSKQLSHTVPVLESLASMETTRLTRHRMVLNVTGTVVDQSGEPLIGVNVIVKGTTKGTSTDFEGRFTLTDVNENANLIFSYIGYSTQEVALGGRSNVNIVLEEDLQTLDEVVVVGYGTQKKSVLTGSISSIQTSDIENQQIGRVEQALQGRVSGMTIVSSSGAPGAASTVRIRGTTSLNSGASDPLYVVDGVVVGTGGIDYLNPGDIASIEVLKDAASAAIYGARASAGVIMITTHKGKSGGLNVKYNGYFGLQSPASKLNLLNASQYAMMQNEQAVNGGGDPIFTNPESYGEGTDWQDVVYNDNSPVQSHELSIGGGNDNSTFYTSFGYFGQEGIVTPEISGFDRYNVRLNSTHTINDWLTLGQTIGYSHIKNLSGVSANNNFLGPLSSAMMLDPITEILQTDASKLNSAPYSTQAVVRDAQGRPFAISEHVAQQMVNPLAYVQTRKGNYNWSDDIVGNAYVQINPLDNLVFKSTIGTTLSYTGNEGFTPIYYLNSNQDVSQTSFTRFRGKVFNWNLENTLSYSSHFNLHSLNILLGQGAYVDGNSSGVTVSYFNIPAKTFEDASLNYSVSAEDIEASGYEGILHKVNSIFGRVTYSFDEKYLFTGILRRDGSSRFGANYKYGYFPSASAGWVISREKFWPQTAAIDFVKVRGSYGVTGNDVLGNFRYISTVGDGRNYPFGFNNYLIGYSPDAPANPNLKWEQTSQVNVGADFIFLEHWNATLDWYKKRTSEILQPVVFPSYVGATGSSYGNVADMDNTGLELELGYRRDIGDIHLDLRGNLSYLKNEVVFLGDEKEFITGDASLQNSTYELTRTALGHAIGSFYGFKTLGIFQNQNEIDSYTGSGGELIQPGAVPGDFQWQDTDGDGTITENDRIFIGDPTPDWSFGFTCNANFQNFDLLLFGQGVIGNQIFQGVRRLDIPTGNWQVGVLDRWHGEGTSNAYPRVTTKDANNNFSNPSDFHIENGDYFRIKTLQIGYSAPALLIQKLGFSRIRVYVSSNNFLTFTKYTGYDPEIGGSNFGIDKSIYPQSKSFLLGLNIGF